MKKCYTLFLLLLCGMVSFAQNSMQLAYTAPAGSLILDYRYGKVLTVRENAGSYIYNLVDVKTGTSTPIPLTRKYQPLSYKHIAGHYNAWITQYGALIVAQSPTNDSVWALYELYGSRFKQVGENVGLVRFAGNIVYWASLDSANTDPMHPRYRNLVFRYMQSDSQYYSTDTTAIIDFALGGLEESPNNYFAIFSVRKDIFPGGGWENNDIGVDHIWQTSIDKRPAYFYGVNSDRNVNTYLRFIQGENTDVAINDSRGRFLKMPDKGSAIYFQDVVSGPRAAVIDYKAAVLAGVIKTNTDTNRLEGKIYTWNYYDSTEYLQDVQPGTPFAYVHIDDISRRGADIGLRASAEGQPPSAYLFSRDGRLKKKVADNATGVYYDYNQQLWFVTDTQHLYYTNIDTVYNYYIAASEKEVFTEIRNPLSFSDFNGPYSGPDTGLGSLQRIQITAFPKQGVLVGKNNQPILGNNSIIERADLDSLKYSATRIPGRDSIRFRAYDGVKWTADSVLRFLVSKNPGIATPFERTTLAGTPIRMWAANFKQHYNGTPLAYVLITVIPKYGDLTLGRNGPRIYWDRGGLLTPQEMDSLYYMAFPNITGVDTFKWQGGNGISNRWSNEAAGIMRVYPVLNTPPILRTLESAYSKAAAPDTILIANYPRPTWHTDALVIVDNSRILPVDSNKNFILDPAVYSTGQHQLKVYFKHPLDSIGITRSFTITGSLLAPMMVGERYGIATDGDEDAGPLQASPNPFVQEIAVTGLSANKTYQLQLYDTQGRLLLTDRSFDQSRKVLQLGGIATAKGIYYLQVYDTDSKTVIRTIKLLHL